jgi:hypothetical protein
MYMYNVSRIRIVRYESKSLIYIIYEHEPSTPMNTLGQ